MYEELFKLGKEEVERLRRLYDAQVITVRAHTDYSTGKCIYEEPVPEGTKRVHTYSNAAEFLKMTPDFEKLTPEQLYQLGAYNNDNYRPSFLAYKD